MDETAGTLAFGVGLFLSGRDLDGIPCTDATFFCTGRRVPPKMEGRVRRASYRAGWQRLAVRLTIMGAVTETGYLPDATRTPPSPVHPRPVGGTAECAAGPSEVAGTDQSTPPQEAVNYHLAGCVKHAEWAMILGPLFGTLGLGAWLETELASVRASAAIATPRASKCPRGRRLRSVEFPHLPAVLCALFPRLQGKTYENRTISA